MRSVPNILSAFRICLVPIFVFSYFSDNHDTKIIAAVIYALAAFTDFLDGFIARKFNATSNLGMVLDPLGDKLMTISVLACITFDGVIPVWVVIVALVKEALMAAGGLIVHKIALSEIPPSNICGKASTVVFFVVCVTLMLFRSIPHGFATIMISAAIGLMLVALGSYVNTFLLLMKNREAK